jgi:hypothetical protein
VTDEVIYCDHEAFRVLAEHLEATIAAKDAEIERLRAIIRSLDAELDFERDDRAPHDSLAPPIQEKP